MILRYWASYIMNNGSYYNMEEIVYSLTYFGVIFGGPLGYKRLTLLRLKANFLVLLEARFATYYK